MPSRLTLVTLMAPALALAVLWSIGMWRRAITARARRLADRTRELELRLRHAHGELGQWERRARSAAVALADVAAALPSDIATAERRIARLADDLREALSQDTARQLRIVPSASARVRQQAWRPHAVPHERSA
ncbi:MAG: hypothetical protein ACT4PJ_06670 [Gemmatimonadaceae bacterium]